MIEYGKDHKPMLTGHIVTVSSIILAKAYGQLLKPDAKNRCTLISSRSVAGIKMAY